MTNPLSKTVAGLAASPYAIVHPEGFPSWLKAGVRRGVLLTMAAAPLVVPALAMAADAEWNGSISHSFTTPGNWTPGAMPTNGVATFGTTGSGEVTIDGGVQINGFVFTGDAGAYTFNSLPGQYVILNSGGFVTASGSGANSQTFITPIALRGSIAFTNNYTNAGKILTFSGNLFGNINTGTILTLGGSNTGANEVSGPITDTKALSLTVDLTKSGTGNWIVSGANTYSGATQVNGGLLLVTGTHTGGSSYTIDGGFLGGAGGKISVTGGITMTDSAGSGINVSGVGQGAVGSQNAMTGPGTLELALGSSSLDLSNAKQGSLIFALAAPEASDLVKLSSGTLDIGFGVIGLSTFQFDTSNWGVDANGIYTLISTSSSNAIVGSLATDDLTGILEGHNVSLSIGVDGSGFQTLQLNVEAIPEPATVEAVAAGFALLAATRIPRKRP